MFSENLVIAGQHQVLDKIEMLSVEFFANEKVELKSNFAIRFYG